MTTSSNGARTRKANGRPQQTAEARTREEILRTLDRLGGLTVQEDTLTFEGDRFVLPESMRGRVGDAVQYLRDWQEQQEETYSFSRTFPYRPWDGAAAFDRAMKRLFGSTGVGQAQVSFFGVRPPELRTIKISATDTIQVPWGEINFTPLEATFYTGATRDREMGIVFELTVQAPRKHRRRIEGFYKVIEDELREHSIYRGKAIDGSPEEPGFLDLSTVDASTVVYSADVMTQLGANLWSLLDHTALMRELRIPLKRAVLVEGPYGTGKTLAGALTAQRAVANGWTFVLARPGRDDLMTTLRTAQLYAPAVVWFEDIDTIGSGGTDMFVSKLLDALDGIAAKGVEVVAGFTTNHVDRIHKGLLRPGRIDTVIHIGELDAAGFERLVKVSVPAGNLDPAIDYAKVAQAMTGYVPAFAREAIDRAMRYAIARSGGHLDKVTTADLVNAAQGLRAQHALMEDAPEATGATTVDSAIEKLLEDTLGRTRVFENQEDPFVVDERNPSVEGVDR